MKRFEYLTPQSLTEALEMLDNRPEAIPPLSMPPSSRTSISQQRHTVLAKAHPISAGLVPGSVLC
jgi:hypothetical protein